MQQRLRLFLALALLILGAVSAWGNGIPSFDRSTVEVRSGRSTHRFQVELALTPAQREQGLMGRDTLAPDAGMLFVFETEHVAFMWMHDTRIPLDMLFLARDGRIAELIENTTPLSDKILSSKVPVAGVLELRAGTARRLGIRRGDRVLHPSLKPRP